MEHKPYRVYSLIRSTTYKLNYILTDAYKKSQPSQTIAICQGRCITVTAKPREMIQYPQKNPPTQQWNGFCHKKKRKKMYTMNLK